MIRGRRERLGEEDDVGVLGLDRRDEPLPEAHRLGVRVVDPEYPHAAGGPEPHDLVQCPPQLPPRLGAKVERVDVLIALRGVLRVADGAVREMAEPLRVFGHPGMVG